MPSRGSNKLPRPSFARVSCRKVNSQELCVGAGIVPFHVAIGRFQRGKSVLRVEAVCVAGDEDGAAETLERGVLVDAVHEELTQSAAAVGFEDEDVAEIDRKSTRLNSRH